MKKSEKIAGLFGLAMFTLGLLGCAGNPVNGTEEALTPTKSVETGALLETPVPTATTAPTSTPTPTPTKALVFIEGNGPAEPANYIDWNIEVTDEHIEYFKNSLFVGDSLMAHFRTFYWQPQAKKGVKTAYKESTNLGTISFSAIKAIDESESGLKDQYIFGGKNMYIWDIVKEMGVERVFIELGSNDLYFGVNKFVDNCQTLARRIEKVNPGVKIIFYSMTPMNHEWESKVTVDNGVARGLNNENIRLANELLEEMCDMCDYGFINIYYYVVDVTGHLAAPYDNNDSIHETAEAYAIWDQITLKYANEHMNK